MKELLAVLRNRNMALLLSGRMISVLGDYLYQIALSVAIYKYSGGATFFVGLFWVVRLVPTLIIGPFVGSFADRIGYRRAMLAADLLRMLLVAVLALILRSSTWPIIYPFALGVTSLNSLFRPANVALIPSLVRSKEERLAANAVVIEVNAIGMIVGSAVGGLGAGVGLTSLLLLIDAGTFAASATALFFIHPSPTSEPARQAPPAQRQVEAQAGVVARFRFLASRPLLVFAASVMVLPELAGGAILVWIVPYSERSLHLGGAGVGYLYAVMGIGMAVGGFAAAIVGGNIRLDYLLVASVALGGVALTLFGVWAVAVPALFFIAVMGAAERVEYAAYQTLLQQAVPETMIGQAAGAMESLFYNMMLIGNLVSGLLVSWLGVTVSIAGLGILEVAVAGLAWWNLRLKTADQPDAAVLARVPAFATLPIDVREWAVRRMVREQFPAGTVVVRQGDPGDKFYAIAEGTAEVEVAMDSQTKTRRLGQGDYFGEIALLQNTPRTATVRALDPLTTYVLSREDFQELQRRASEFKESLMQTAVTRLAEDTNFKMALATRS
jgi:MFS family permease